MKGESAPRWGRPASFAAPVYERHDGARIHLGGLVKPWGLPAVMAHVHDPQLWARCVALEPKRRRALMLFVDTAWPVFDLIDELGKLLDEAGVTIKLGLEAQGHVPTIVGMLADGHDWPAIGKQIGWHPPTAREWWERLCGKLTAYDAARDDAFDEDDPTR